ALGDRKPMRRQEVLEGNGKLYDAGGKVLADKLTHTDTTILPNIFTENVKKKQKKDDLVQW
ncbi:MAG: hypothetical protein J6333_10380, partial [Planctomycetes bacterium]|nr:hypothetical protein [Planctomycetota bacterium]